MTNPNSSFIALAFIVGGLLYFGYYSWLLWQNKKLRAFAALTQPQPKK